MSELRSQRFPVRSHDLVAAWLLFTVIASKVRYEHTGPRDGRCETVLLDHPIAVCVCVYIYPCIISTYSSILIPCNID